MARVRCITEMGMGVDVHGKDATKAAKRAVSDAIRHSSLSFVRMVGKTPHDMFVDVTIGVPNPDDVDTAAVEGEVEAASQIAAEGLIGVRGVAQLMVQVGQPDQSCAEHRRHLGVGDTIRLAIAIDNTAAQP